MKWNRINTENSKLILWGILAIGFWVSVAAAVNVVVLITKIYTK